MNNVFEGGWVVNTGEMPVSGDTKVDTKWMGDYPEYNDCADTWCWDDEQITHWRLHNAACGDTFQGLEEAYNHKNTPVRMTAKEYIASLEPLEEQPIGLPLSRVCKAFTAITCHPMSEEHAETFLKVVEMCKGFATEND